MHRISTCWARNRFQLALLACVWACSPAVARAQDIEQIEQQYVRAMQRGDFIKAIEAAQQARDVVLRQAPNEAEALAVVYQYLGDAYNGRGLYSKALDAYRQGYDLMRRTRGDSAELAAFMTAFGNVLFQTGRLEEGETWIRRALQTYEKQSGPESAGVADCLYRLGTMYGGLGQYAEAETLLRRSLEIARRLSDTVPSELCYIYDSLADLYIDQHRLNEAEAMVLKSLEIRRRDLPADHIDHVENAWALGMIYAQRGKYEAAEKQMTYALRTYESKLGPDHYLTANVRFYAADVHAKLGRWDQASLMYQKVLDSARRITGGDEHPEAVWVYNALANVHLRKGDLDRAREYADEAISIGELANVPAQRFVSHLLLSQVLWQQGSRSSAVAELEEAMRFAEQQRGLASGADHQRARFFVSFAEAFERMVQWQAELGDLDAALEAMERSRARSLLDQMQQVDLLAGLPAEEAENLRAEEHSAREEVTRLEAELNQIRTEDSLSEEQRISRAREVLARLHESRKRLVDAYAAIRNASPAYRLAAMKGEQAGDLLAVQEYLEDQEGLLLQYLLGEQGAYVLVVPGRGEPQLSRLELAADQAASLALEPNPLNAARLQQALLNEAKTGVLDEIRRVGTNPQQARDVSTQLHALWEVLLPADARARILDGSVKRLFVVPDGPLTMLPFEALVVDLVEGRPKYLLDVGPPVIYAPSSTILLNLSEKPDGPIGRAAKPVLSVGDPAYDTASTATIAPGATSAPSRYQALGGPLSRLPYSAWETAWLEQVFGKHGIPVEKLTGSNATEANVRRDLENRPLVHLACHGLTDSSYGNMFGALALAPGRDRPANPNNDGFLTLAEIYGLPLQQCELAILSACDTNVGPQQRGEGVWALSRGFLVAGSKRVVASNWYVDDRSAAGLISYFCSGIAQATGDEKPIDYAESLHKAKRWVRAQETWSSPYYWATFVLVGPP